MRHPALWLIALVAKKADREPLIGDLMEESRELGSRWLWRQVLRSVGPLMWRRVRKDGPVVAHFLAVVVAAYLAIAIPIMVYHALFPQMSETMSLILDLPMAVGAGYLTAYLGRRRGRQYMRAFAILMGTMSVISIAGSWGMEPVWYQAVLSGSMLVSVMLGGYLRVRTIR